MKKGLFLFCSFLLDFLPRSIGIPQLATHTNVNLREQGWRSGLLN